MVLLTVTMSAQVKQQNTMKKEAKKQTAGRDRLGDFAPKFAQLNDDVLFGQVWSREGELSPRDRSMVTIATLIGSGAPEFTIKAHLTEGKKNGISKDEIAEVITLSLLPKKYTLMKSLPTLAEAVQDISLP